MIINIWKILSKRQDREFWKKGIYARRNFNNVAFTKQMIFEQRPGGNEGKHYRQR